jgi:hypothetical protein
MDERYHLLRFFGALIIISLAMGACKEPEAAVLPTLTGTVIISGTAYVGHTLTADTDSLGGTGTISYQWKRGGGSAAISIGSNDTYVVQTVDLGSTITVTVTRSGNSGDKTSDPTAAVILPPLPETVIIIGNAWVGQTLTVITGFPDDTEGIGYQWKQNETIIIGTDSSYLVQITDLGSTITVTVTHPGYSGTLSSEPTAAVIIPLLSGTVSIDGLAEVGQTLTANTADLDGTGTISYQWKRRGTGGLADTPIGVNRTYTVRSADQGRTLTVTVTRSGYSGNVVSDPTDTVPTLLTGAVTISGTVAVGQTLTANTSNLNGTSAISYEWKRGADTIGTDSAYTLQDADEGYYITVTVTRNGYSGTITSNAVRIGSQIYGEFIRKVEFTETTATVTFDDLSNKSVYLVKVNTSATQVAANATGSVQAAPTFLSNSELSYTPDESRPRKGHPAATASNANPPPIESKKATFQPRVNYIPPVVGDTRSFLVETTFNTGRFGQRQATILATGEYGNIWVINNVISSSQAQALATNFDKIYPAETNILGYEFGGGPNGDGGKDGDPKIQILVYDFGSTSVIGYFWNKDFYDNQAGSNKAEIFYLNSSYVKSSPMLAYLTLAHEFQHMINFNQKYVKNGKNTATWYDETLSMMTEDIMANILGVPTTDQYHPIRDHIPFFIDSYADVGVTEWPNSPYPYSKGYAFGAYLMRNYVGAELLEKILANNAVNIESITVALNELNPGLTFETAMSRFGEAMIFSATSMPPDALTFDKTVDSTVTAHNGTHTYKLPGFDIWNIGRSSFNSITKGPVVYSTTQKTMRGHTVLIQQADTWKNRTGSLSITLNRPSNANIELYLMVR